MTTGITTRSTRCKNYRDSLLSRVMTSIASAEILAGPFSRISCSFSPTMNTIRSGNPGPRKCLRAGCRGTGDYQFDAWIVRYKRRAIREVRAGWHERGCGLCADRLGQWNNGLDRRNPGYFAVLPEH